MRTKLVWAYGNPRNVLLSRYTGSAGRISSGRKNRHFRGFEEVALTVEAGQTRHSSSFTILTYFPHQTTASAMTCQLGSRNGCSSACCGGQSKEIKPMDACAPKTPSQGPGSCCTGTTQKPQEEDNEPECCKDKPSPCCDISCVDRIALRECDKKQVLSPNNASSSKFQCAFTDCHPNRCINAGLQVFRARAAKAPTANHATNTAVPRVLNTQRLSKPWVVSAGL